MTALLWASVHGHLPVVRELVDVYKVNVFQKNKVCISSPTTHTHARTHAHTHYPVACKCTVGTHMYCSGSGSRKSSHISEQFIQLNGNTSCRVCGTTCNKTHKYKRNKPNAMCEMGLIYWLDASFFITVIIVIVQTIACPYCFTLSICMLPPVQHSTTIAAPLS